jgi:hypothetical protein
MFSLSVVGSDQFLDMSAATRELYFELGMYADDDGFVSHKKVMRMCGASEDDMRVLVSKKFVIPFDTGVIVISHWNENNYIQKDRYKPTLFTYEKSHLQVEDNVYKLDTECTPSIGKYRLGEDRVVEVSTEPQKEKKSQKQDASGFTLFWEGYPKKEDKVSAFAEWGKLSQENKSAALADVPRRILTEDWTKDNGKFIPLAKTYLKNHRWEDILKVNEPETIKSYGKPRN